MPTSLSRSKPARCDATSQGWRPKWPGAVHAVRCPDERRPWSGRERPIRSRARPSPPTNPGADRAGADRARCGPCPPVSISGRPTDHDQPAIGQHHGTLKRPGNAERAGWRPDMLARIPDRPGHAADGNHCRADAAQPAGAVREARLRDRRSRRFVRGATGAAGPCRRWPGSNGAEWILSLARPAGTFPGNVDTSKRSWVFTDVDRGLRRFPPGRAPATGSGWHGGGRGAAAGADRGRS